MLAQRYPDASDGLFGSCPAINWARFLSAGIYPQLVLRGLAGDEVPPPYEFGAIMAAALKGCDGLDGVEDGYVMDPRKCDFQASSVMGNEIECSDLPSGRNAISESAARAAEATWAGYHTEEGVWRYYGVSQTTNITSGGTLASTTCVGEGNCTQSLFGIGINWAKKLFDEGCRCRSNVVDASAI
jgi:hypothetical protein